MVRLNAPLFAKFAKEVNESVIADLLDEVLPEVEELFSFLEVSSVFSVLFVPRIRSTGESRIKVRRTGYVMRRVTWE